MRYIHLLRPLQPFPDSPPYDSGVYGESVFNIDQMTHFVTTGAAVWFEIETPQKVKEYPALPVMEPYPSWIEAETDKGKHYANLHPKPARRPKPDFGSVIK